MANLTSVYNLSSQVLGLIDRIDKDIQIDRREVMDALRQGSIKFLKQDYFEKLQMGQKFIDPHYVARFTKQPILVDADRYGRNYIDIPCQYVALPENEGIQRVWPVTEDEEDYIEMTPIPYGNEEIYRNLSINNALIGVWTYSVTKDKIYFGRNGEHTLKDKDITSVDIDVVIVSPLDVGDDDPFPLPPEYHLDLITSVIQLFAPNPERVHQVVTQEVIDELRGNVEILNKQLAK
jgi:hypothetical protein